MIYIIFVDRNFPPFFLPLSLGFQKGEKKKAYLNLNVYLLPMIQGKYQLQVFPEAGHFIHEDLPARTAQVLVDFFKRNDRSAFVLPPKVGDKLASAAMAKGFLKKP